MEVAELVEPGLDRLAEPAGNPGRIESGHIADEAVGRLAVARSAPIALATLVIAVAVHQRDGQAWMPLSGREPVTSLPFGRPRARHARRSA